MPSEGYPKPDKDSKIPEELDKGLDEFLGSLPKIKPEAKKLPEAFRSFPDGSIEDLVCQIIIAEYSKEIDLKKKEVLPWEKDEDNDKIEYQLPEDEKERNLLNEILEDNTIKFLKYNIFNEHIRELGFQLEREGKLKQGRTRALHMMMEKSKGEVTGDVQNEFMEIIQDTIDRIILGK